MKLDPQTHIFGVIYIWNQFHQENIISMSIWPHLFLYSKKEKKNGIFARKKEWIYRPNTLACRLLAQISLSFSLSLSIKSVSSEERQKHIYMATPISLFKKKKKKKKKKKGKNGTSARKNNGAIGLKLWHADTT